MTSRVPWPQPAAASRASRSAARRLLGQVLDARAPAVAHAGPQPAHELLDHGGEGTLVGDHPLDPLWDELLGARVVLLEVAVPRALLHGPHRTHAPVALEGAALAQDQLARALVGPREERADHHRRGPRRDRLHHVVRDLEPT